MLDTGTRGTIPVSPCPYLRAQCSEWTVPYAQYPQLRSRTSRLRVVRAYARVVVCCLCGRPSGVCGRRTFGCRMHMCLRGRRHAVGEVEYDVGRVCSRGLASGTCWTLWKCSHPFSLLTPSLHPCYPGPLRATAQYYYPLDDPCPYQSRFAIRSPEG